MNRVDFQIHPRLESDLIPIMDLSLCHIRMQPNSELPWIILIPRLPNKIEIIDLQEADQIQLMTEISHCSQMMKTLFQPDKLNVASLGNMVEQLHIHIIGRFKSDKCWPNACFGVELERDQNKIETNNQRIKEFLKRINS